MKIARKAEIIIMNKKLMLSLCAAGAITVSGCTTVADMAGADTATLNATATKSYNEMVQDARNKNQLDTSSTTYKRINTVFQRLIPHANQMNQTGQPFQWQLAVLKSDQSMLLSHLVVKWCSTLVL